MSYSRKTYAYLPDGKQVCFNGHITKETAIKRGFARVTLTIVDNSGRGRGENRHFRAPFSEMKAYS